MEYLGWILQVALFVVKTKRSALLVGVNTERCRVVTQVTTFAANLLSWFLLQVSLFTSHVSAYVYVWVRNSRNTRPSVKLNIIQNPRNIAELAWRNTFFFKFQIDVMRDYVSCSKFTHKRRLHKIFFEPLLRPASVFSWKYSFLLSALGIRYCNSAVPKRGLGKEAGVKFASLTLISNIAISISFGTRTCFFFVSNDYWSREENPLPYNTVRA